MSAPIDVDAAWTHFSTILLRLVARQIQRERYRAAFGAGPTAQLEEHERRPGQEIRAVARQQPPGS
jgi:hypothetical protein